jgi:hypothetical protein
LSDGNDHIPQPTAPSIPTSGIPFLMMFIGETHGISSGQPPVGFAGIDTERLSA